MSTYENIKKDIQDMVEIADMNENSVYAEFKPDYYAHASGNFHIGYHIDYYKGENPAYFSEEYDTIEELVSEMMKISMDWEESEVE
jgi:hypothetical protein